MLLLIPAFANARQTPPASDLKLVEIEDISVTGTHLPAASVVRLSGIKLHDKVNDLIVKAACHKITATGMVSNIDYSYDIYLDRPTVVLNLKLTDEGPLLPATIKPAAEDKTLWSCLESRDPMFQRQFPPTEKALNFYANNLGSCLKAASRNDEYAQPAVTADVSGKLNAITFEIRKYKNTTSK